MIYRPYPSSLPAVCPDILSIETPDLPSVLAVEDPSPPYPESSASPMLPISSRSDPSIAKIAAQSPLGTILARDVDVVGIGRAMEGPMGYETRLKDYQTARLNYAEDLETWAGTIERFIKAGISEETISELAGPRPERPVAPIRK